jgi:hypothetical protein
MTTKEFTCHFKLARTTKRTVLYEQVTEKGKPYSVNDGAEIGSIYLRTETCFGEDPIAKHITVTVHIKGEET